MRGPDKKHIKRLLKDIGLNGDGKPQIRKVTN